MVLVSGKSGVGKSRFALEGCRNFVSQHPEFKAYSIVSQSQNLYEDLIEKFSLPGQYLILVDDANRVIKFSYFTHILRSRKENQQIKIVVTVRDYALEKINNDVFNHPHYSMQLESLSNDQIKELAKTEFGILNPRYLERIEELSGGNPRIAVMISKVATDKNTLDSINDVSALYDGYFSSIKEDLQNLGETDLLKVAGIISFLRAVDRTNDQMMSGIQLSFGVSPDTFWDYAFRLHELELVDMYENEVVRISDQVLATYLFHSAFFKEKLLDFSSILQNYFPNFLSKIIDALNPTLSAFDENKIFDILRPKVQKLWDELDAANDEEKLLALAKSFWFLNQAKILSFIRKRLSQSPYAPADLSQLDLVSENKNNNVTLTTEIQLLGRFRYAMPELRKIALETVIEYLKIRPAEILQVLHVLTDDYGFVYHTHSIDTSMPSEVTDLLWEYSQNGREELYSRLYIAVANEYLKVNFEFNEMRSKSTVRFGNIALEPKPEVFQIRAKIFNHLFELYKSYPNHVFSTLVSYTKNYYHVAFDEIFLNDSFEVLNFIQTSLDSKDYKHNIFANGYLDFLEEHNINFDITLREKFQSEIYLVYCLLSEKRKDLLKFSHEEYLTIRKENFTSYFLGYSKENIKLFIDQCIKIETDFRQEHDRYDIVYGFELAMNVLAESQPEMFKSALVYYLQQGDELGINSLPLIKILIDKYGTEETYSFLEKTDFPSKNRWLFGYYQALPKEKIGKKDLGILYDLFQKTDQTQMPSRLDFLLDYTQFDSRFLAKVALLILENCDANYSAWILNTITNPYSDIHKKLEIIFGNDVEILKRIYLTVKSSKEHDDHNSATLSKILDLDLGFIDEYIEWIFTPKSENSRWHHALQDYSLLWRNKNYEKIFLRIIDLVYQKEKSGLYFAELRWFFVHDEEQRIDADIEQKQEEIMIKLINQRHNDADFMAFIFESVASFPKERRSRLIFTFLQHNKKLSDFQQLTIEPYGMSWSGSAVPVIQERIDFLKSLLPMMNKSDLLDHQVYLHKLIERWENRKNTEKKNDFIGSDF